MRKAVFRVSDQVQHNPCGTAHSHRRLLEAWNFGFRNKRGSLVCFRICKKQVSCDAAQIITCVVLFRPLCQVWRLGPLDLTH